MRTITSPPLVASCYLLSSDALEGPLDVLYRIPQNHWASMWTAHGTVRLGQLLEQPLHFVLFERHVDFDGGVAGDRSSDLCANLLQIEGLLFALELLEDLVQHVLDFRRGNARRCGLHRDGANAEGLDLEAVVIELVRDLRENSHLARRKLDQQRYEHLLVLGRIGETLAQDLLKEHAFVRDVLVDDPQSLRVDGEDERIANLPKRFERSKRVEADGSIVVDDPSSAAVVMGDYGRHVGKGTHSIACLGTCNIRKGLRAEARHRNCSVCFDVNADVAEVQGRGERWGFLSTQGEGKVSFVDVQRVSVR